MSIQSTGLGDSEKRGITVLRKAAVCEALAISPWTLDRWIRRGLFPSPTFLTPTSNVAVWRLSEIAAFLDKRRRARRVKQLRGAMKKVMKPAHPQARGGGDATD
jgi:predicted DNA-binding transcriptional regulator AlpA